MKKLLLSLVLLSSLPSFAGGNIDKKYFCGVDVTDSYNYDRWGSKWGLNQASYDQLSDQAFLDAYELSNIVFGNNSIAVEGRFELLSASIDKIGPVPVHTSDYVSPEDSDYIDRPYYIGHLRSRFIQYRVDLGADDSPQFIEDYCKDASTKIAHGCKSDTSLTSLERVKTAEIPCTRGCLNGACVAPEYIETSGGSSGGSGEKKGKGGEGGKGKGGAKGKKK